MRIELYKDIDKLISDFNEKYPNIVCGISNYFNGERNIKEFIVLITDEKLITKINGEVFQFKGNVMKTPFTEGNYLIIKELPC